MAEFPGIATKATPAATDGLLVDDQADSGNAKRSAVSGFQWAASQIASGTLAHERGGLEADVSAYSGLVAISGGATSEVDSKAELEAQIADVTDFAMASGDTFTDLVLANNISQSANTNNVISANAATIDLSTNNHQSLDLAAATGAVTVTLTAPDGPCAGTLAIKQDATARDITWVSGTGITAGVWLGTEPTWSSDTAEKRRIVSWRFDGTDIFLAVTDEETATF